MQSNRKKKKILKPFVRDERLYQRLQKYIGDHENKRRKRSSLCIMSPQANSSSKKQKWRSNGNVAAEQNDCGLASSDSDISDYFEEDKLKAENFANTSLRNAYAKSFLDDSTTSSTPLFTDGSKKHSSNFATEDDYNSNSGLTENFDKMRSSSDSSKIVKKSKFSKKEKIKDIQEKNGLVSTFPVEVPHETFVDVGGMDDILEDIFMLFMHLIHPNLYEDITVKQPTRGVLLHGPSGCGKTLIARAIAGELSIPLIDVTATEIVRGISGESEKEIRELFTYALNNSPCILFIDEIDAITPKKEVAQKEMEKRIVTQLAKCMDDLNRKDPTRQVMVIGATNRPNSLDPSLRRAGRFDREISIGIPNENSRLQILELACRDLSLAPDFSLRWLARNTPGYVGADLMLIAGQASNTALRRVVKKIFDSKKTENVTSGLNDCRRPLLRAVAWMKANPPLNEKQKREFCIEVQDFEAALHVYVPCAKREGFATIPSVTWEDVGALNDKKEELQECILWPIMYRQEFEEFHIPVPTGILLCGPKGCGKTLLAKAVANECSINFLSVKGPELLNMYVGESERAVRECFQRAKNSSPCVIFFDEIDALCPPRSSTNENAAAERVVNQLLTEMDGIEGRKEVFVMGATNRPENIDSAMLRPGRFETTVFINVPGQADRYDILRTITKDGTRPKLAKEVDLEKLSQDKRCEGFSGADLTSLVRAAAFRALKDYNNRKSQNAQEKPVFEVTLKHFECAFSKVKPSVSQRDMDYLKKSLFNFT